VPLGESVGKKVAKEIMRRSLKTPGLGYVIFVFTTVVTAWLGRKEEYLPYAMPFLVAAAAIAFYWLGGFLDALAFDQFFSRQEDINHLATQEKPKSQRWWKLWADTEVARENAARFLRAPEHEREGIYATAKRILRATDKWDGKITLLLDLSKTARTLLLPFLLLVLFDLAVWSTGWRVSALESRPKLAWLGRWWIAALLLMSAYVLFINLRLRHMGAMYRALNEDDCPLFTFSVHRDDVGSQKVEPMLCIAGSVFARSALPIFGGKT